MPLQEEERWRYARHLMMPELGAAAYERLKAVRVLVVGAGGLGSAILYYLAAAGVGTLGIVDFDIVEHSNLARQILHTTADLGRPKVVSAAEKLAALNPHVRIEQHPVRFTADNGLDLVSDYDVVVTGIDNFPTRYLLNDACVLTRKTLVEGAVLRFLGLAMTIKGGETTCYRCLFPDPPPDYGLICSTEVGVFGPIAGLIGLVQAAEVLKVAAGFGKPLYDRLLQVDAGTMTFEEVSVERSPACPVCGASPSITALHEYAVENERCRRCMAGAVGRPEHWDTSFIDQREPTA